MIAYLLILLIGLKINATAPFWILWGAGAICHIVNWALED